MSRLNKTLAWGITYRQVLLVLAMYLVAAILYDGALTISQRPWSKEPFWTDFINEIPRILLDYGFKLIATIPVWYLLFVRLRHLPLIQRVLSHVVLLPLYIMIWQGIYYITSDLLEVGRLRGDGQVWDTYIGSLFYLVQFGIFHAYAYYRDYQRQRIREAELRELAVKSELSAIKAQLNPHFLYNVFNTISASVPPEQEHTRELLADLSDLFRYQLRASRTELVTVAEEVAFVQKYLDLEKARFGDRLRMRFDIADGVENAQIPPMLLQPLVENSIKHGISPLIEGGEVSISIRPYGDQLQVKIADTGVGMHGSKEIGYGVGLANTRLRLEKMFNGNLEVTDTVPQGVTVSFQVPLIKRNSAVETPRAAGSLAEV